MIQTRRDFLSKSALLAGAAAVSFPTRASAAPAAGQKFQLRFGPHQNMFRGKEGELALIEAYRQVDAK